MKFNNKYFLKLNYGFKNSLKFEDKIYNFNKIDFLEVPEELYKLHYLKMADYTCIFQGANCPVKIPIYISKIERIAIDDEEQIEDIVEGTNKVNLAVDSMEDKTGIKPETKTTKPKARKTSTRKTTSRKIK